MYKDILVCVPSIQAASPVVDFAISLAETTGARLDAVAFGYEPMPVGIPFDGGVAIAALMESQRQQALEKAAAALAVFENQAKATGITYNCRRLSAPPAEAAETMGELSRLYELTVVLQPQATMPLFDELIPQSVLFNSGGPMLVVPYIHKGAFKADNVLICWNGKREAARAVRDAMPFLKQAKTVKIVAANEDESEIGQASSQALAAHLERQGISAKVQRLTETGSDIFNAILSTAADSDAEMIVMGGYGHSRLREFMLGGVTRGIFQTMTVPVLMSH